MSESNQTQKPQTQSKPNRRLYYVEITDTFSGEANYSWVTRHIIRARSTLGAVNALSRRSGITWHKVADYGDSLRYDSKSGATCAFIAKYLQEETDYSYYRFDTDDRTNKEK